MRVYALDEKGHGRTELRDEWLPRPFALSPASYYSMPYPGTERIAAMKAELSRALKEQAKEQT